MRPARSSAGIARAAAGGCAAAWSSAAGRTRSRRPLIAEIVERRRAAGRRRPAPRSLRDNAARSSWQNVGLNSTSTSRDGRPRARPAPRVTGPVPGPSSITGPSLSGSTYCAMVRASTLPDGVTAPIASGFSSQEPDEADLVVETDIVRARSSRSCGSICFSSARTSSIRTDESVLRISVPAISDRRQSHRGPLNGKFVTGVCHNWIGSAMRSRPVLAGGQTRPLRPGSPVRRRIP